MADDRKGFLTPDQERQLDDLKEWSSRAAEAVDGLAIKYADNLGLEKLKPKIEEKWPDSLETIYEIIDSIFEMLPKKSD